MPPKQRSWAQIRRTGLATRRMAFNSMPTHSAFNTLTSRNLENTTAGYIRRVEAEAADNPQPKPARKPQATPAPKKKIEKTKKAAKPRRRAKKVIEEEDDEDEKPEPEPEPVIESWRPYRGESAPLAAQKTRCLGIGRISEWQYTSFKEAFEDKFGAYADVHIVADEINSGGETMVDMRVEWADEDIAEMMMGEINGNVVWGRKVQATYVA